MANRARGEASFETSEGQTITLVMNFGAFAEAEDAVDMGINDILAGLRKGRIKPMRGLMLGAMLAQHPDATLEDIDDILLDPVTSERAGKALMEAVDRFFPAEKAGGEASENPPKPRRSTGTAS